MQNNIQYGRCLLKKRLDKLGMTQARLSEMSGVSHTKISDYIHNRSRMSFITAVKISKVLNCHADELYEWEER